jgi:hypothetical protein
VRERERELISKSTKAHIAFILVGEGKEYKLNKIENWRTCTVRSIRLYYW